jgi:hypothetical protein
MEQIFRLSEGKVKLVARRNDGPDSGVLLAD